MEHLADLALGGRRAPVTRASAGFVSGARVRVAGGALAMGPDDGLGRPRLL
ncbi:MAG: hypothetical protein AAGA37_08080 [Actinomycetota bacterium]